MVWQAPSSMSKPLSELIMPYHQSEVKKYSCSVKENVSVNHICNLLQKCCGGITWWNNKWFTLVLTNQNQQISKSLQKYNDMFYVKHTGLEWKKKKYLDLSGLIQLKPGNVSMKTNMFSYRPKGNWCLYTAHGILVTFVRWIITLFYSWYELFSSEVSFIISHEKYCKCHIYGIHLDDNRLLQM